MSDPFQMTPGAPVWLMPVGSELVHADGVNATWTDGEGVTTSAPHGFVARGNRAWCMCGHHERWHAGGPCTFHSDTEKCRCPSMESHPENGDT